MNPENPSPSLAERDAAARPARRRRSLQFGVVISGVALLAAAVTVRYYWNAEPASAQVGRTASAARTAQTSAQRNPSPAAPAGQESAVVASVNGQAITREGLAREALRHHGNEVLELLVNRHLIAQECRRRGITITSAEVDAEIERMAQRFGFSVEQWMQMLQHERGIQPKHYANDTVWPMLALRRLAGDRLTVDREELEAAFETQYGPQVRVRLIAVSDRSKAESLRARAAADPEEFGNLAKDHSEDVSSAAARGMIQPIRRHTSPPEIEEAVFNLPDGGISPVLTLGDQYVIFQREGLIEARDVSFEVAAPLLEEMVRDNKVRRVAGEVFRDLQEEARVDLVYSDPAKREANPGVAAMINDQAISLRELAEQCLERYGEAILDGMIHRRLIEQACAEARVAVSAEELEGEIRRVAALNLPPQRDGSPDVEQWLAMVSEQEGISEEIYRSDRVWPAVALRKLVADEVEVTREDMEKAFEANYGPRVRVRAIVLDNQRRANQVWDLARQNPTAEGFGTLAEQYSIEASSRVLRGEVPPIRRHGGQPLLEREAFALKPGEISGIIQVGPHYVILFCEGRTEPTPVDPAEVRDILYEDIREKKMQLAMVEYFEGLLERARIDNYLTGRTQAPSSNTAAAANAPRQATAPAPARR